MTKGNDIITTMDSANGSCCMARTGNPTHNHSDGTGSGNGGGRFVEINSAAATNHNTFRHGHDNIADVSVEVYY